MAYRSSGGGGGGFANTRGGNRGTSYNSNNGSPTGSRGGNNHNDSNRSLGNSSFCGSRGDIRGNGGSWSSNSPSTGGYSSMNHNTGSNWSSQGDSNYESRNRFSGNNDRYSSGHNDDNWRYKEGGRSHRDSDKGGYSCSGDDFGRYGSGGGGGSSYEEELSSRSSYAPDNNYGGSSSYRGRESSLECGSDFCKPLPPDDDRSSPPFPKYSGPSNRGRDTRGFRSAERPGMRSSASVSYRGSFGGSAGLIKRKRLEPTPGGPTNPKSKGYVMANRRIHTVKRTSIQNRDVYRARKIAEFREKTRQLRELVSSPSVDEEEVKEEESANDEDCEKPEDDGEKKDKSPKKKKKVIKKEMKIVEKKVKQQKLNGDVSKSGSGDKTSLRKIENNMLDSREPSTKLLCPHCEVTCETFREYETHLLKMRHRIAMSQLARKRKHELFLFRQDLRKKQKEIDDKATEEDRKTEIYYCKLCQLNLKQSKSDHLNSILHKKAKQFLQYACSVCHLIFTSPMFYEHHLCSINHLKKVDIYDHQTKRMAAVQSADEADGDLDMDNFIVLDSVGSGDDEGSEEGENAQDSKNDDKKKSKKEIILGEELIKKVEVYYCELCKLYIPPHDDVEQQLNLHLRNRVHLQLYVQHCEKNKSQEKTAEVVSKECTDEMKSDSNSSNKGAGHEDKHETSDNGDDSSSLNIQHKEKMKNRFDWDAIIGVDKIMPAIAGLSSTPVSTNIKIQSPSKEMESTKENVQPTVIRTEPTKDPSELELNNMVRKRLLNRDKQRRKRARRKAEKLSQAYIPQT